MCKRCADYVHNEMDIRDTDLPYLPYIVVKWYCIVPGCRGHATVRDYGIAPLYYWPLKNIRHDKDGWRGGWFENSHAYMCSRHYKPIIKRQIEMPDHSLEVCAKRFVPVMKKGKLLTISK